MGDDLHIRYGGMRFSKNARAEEINRFVRELPMEDRQSLAMVVRRLEAAGLITLDLEHTITIDDEMQAWQEPNARPGQGQRRE
ncbi:MAG: hypothetical protein GX998_02430 [Firmicutes bacterium]|nr:hypothetical protein [Bacillota bacterium]